MGNDLLARKSRAAFGHIVTQTGVLRLVDHTHPTAAEFLCDFVVGDGIY